MKDIKSIIRHHQLWLVALAVAIGVGFGYVAFHGGNHSHTEASEEKTIWTCSMDPQVRQDHPGKCPICGMDLIPLNKDSHAKSADMDMNPDAITLSDEAMALANVQTETVGTGTTAKELRLFGKIEPDERLEQVQSAYVDGRVERIFINAIGDRVSRGQTLAVIYSPALYAAEQELVQALAFPMADQRKALVEAAVEKLELLQIDRAQINRVIRTKKASPYITLKANTSGTVVDKQVEQGDYVKQGQPLLKIANLTTVWAVFQAYEGDLPFVKVGSTVRFTTESMPGRSFTGKVSFIDPIIDDKSRTAGVRVVMANPNGIFKPQMIISGYAAARMKGYENDIVVPKSAVLWTGKRSVVYVKDEGISQPTFSLREVTLGPSLPDAYVITGGLAEGETIVTNGTFAVDASAQLAGKKSMMNR
ncbi:efflux RND transporter periplasmic adaptor subunit [Hallella multisaccharivorax]|uniref:efflux RND transporter periplasmic adaptor subunit n=1 Tax=Hallella multisaccharivorax TaxID=310514 RepID=UPI0036244F7E